jgi:hypothetical protein
MPAQNLAISGFRILDGADLFLGLGEFQPCARVVRRQREGLTALLQRLGRLLLGPQSLGEMQQDLGLVRSKG